MNPTMNNMFHPPSIFAVIIALILSMGVFSFTAYGSTGDDGGYTSNISVDKNNGLIVNAVWAEHSPDGEMIRIDVTDPQTGDRSSLALPLSAYLQDGNNSEFIGVQAVDASGKKSEIIEIKNPLYNPALTQSETNANNQSSVSENNSPRKYKHFCC